MALDTAQQQPPPASPVTTDYVAVVTPRAGADGGSTANDTAFKIPAGDRSDTKKGSSDSAGGDHAAASDGGKKEEKEAPMPITKLYRYATPFDIASVILGCVMAGANGALFPVMALVFGGAISAFARADGGVDKDAINTAALDYFFLAIGLFVTDYAAYVLFSNTAERQMKALRDEALKHMLYLDIAWYDSHDALQLSSRLTGDTVKIKDGMGHKLGDCFKYGCQFFAGYIIGFARGWDMTLIMICVVPIMALSLMSLLKMMRSRSEYSQKMYAEAGAVAEETLGSIRTVSSLNGERRAIAKYNERALVAESENIDLAKYSSAVFGMFMGSIWIMYAAGLWYGGFKVSRGSTTPSEVFQAFYGVLMGSFSLAQINPSISAVAEARGAAAALYKILDTISVVDASKDDGIIPDSCAGRIQAIDINFTYPSRPDAQILKNYSVTVESGQTVAFVGASGGGKSTLIALLER
ncbi:Multidrug resistance protein abc superfamily, partial [Globisporangium polare]